MKAKLINGVLNYFTQPNHIIGDATAYATEQGYKEVVYPTLTETQLLGNPIENATEITFEVVEKSAEQIRAETVPEKVSNLQLRVGWLLKGITPEQINGYIEMLPSPQKEIAQTALEYSTNIARNNDIVNFISSQLGWTKEQTDEFFIECSKINLND